MPTGLEQPLANLSFGEMVRRVNRLTEATKKNSARRSAARLENEHKRQEARVVALMQQKRKAAEEARKVANYYEAQAKAIQKALNNPTPANVAAANKAIHRPGSFTKGRFHVLNSSL